MGRVEVVDEVVNGRVLDLRTQQGADEEGKSGVVSDTGIDEEDAFVSVMAR